jgi:hypothetical protein
LSQKRQQARGGGAVVAKRPRRDLDEAVLAEDEEASGKKGGDGE